jgi:cell division septum initiation protein DivIVA
MFSADLRKRVESLEAVVAALAINQRTIAESVQTLAESANSNAEHCNTNFESIVESIRQLVDKVSEDSSDDWWREPHD